MSQVTEILETMEYGPAPEAAGQVQQWLAARSPFGHFIAGRFVASASFKSAWTRVRISAGGSPIILEVA